MERDAFLANISSRLGREPLKDAPVRTVVGVTERYKEHPFGQNKVDRARWPEQFRDELQSIGGVVLIAETLSEVPSLMRDVLKKAIGGRIVTWDREAFSAWNVDFLWDELAAISFSKAADSLSEPDLRNFIRTANVGITTVSFAAANSGTLALYTNNKCGRSVSLLPTLHLALVRESQLVARLGEAFPTGDLKTSGDIPSSIHFITGPSRSADIENDLSIGVHGPAAVTVILCRGI